MDPAKLPPGRPGHRLAIMTGAPVPPGADAVLIVEETEAVEGDPQAIRPEERPCGRERAIAAPAARTCARARGPPARR